MPKEKTSSIKFYFNGIRINESKKLVKCSYSLDNSAATDAPSVTICADSYGQVLPRDLFNVVNDTDSQADYFDKDHALLTAEHPLYRYARAAALKAQIISEKKALLYTLKQAESGSPSTKTYYQNESVKVSNDMERHNAELNLMGDVGQPTSEDLRAISALRSENETVAQLERKDLAYYERLLEETANKVFSSPAQWDSFLALQAKVFKYDFFEQLLIYAQNPQATACAEIPVWNERMGRFVTREENAIALITSDGHHSYLRYVFDVADTQGRAFPRLWYYREEHKEAIIAGLCGKLGHTPDSLQGAVQAVLEKDFEEWVDNASDLGYNSFKELKIFRDFSKKSIEKVVLTRCGIETTPFQQEIPALKSTEEQLQAGLFIAKETQSILKRIERAINQYITERRQEHERHALHGEEGRPEERPDLRQERGLLDPDDRAAGIGDKALDPVRSSEVPVSEGTPGIRVRAAQVQGQSDLVLPRGGRESRSAVRSVDEGVAGDRGSDRGIEADEPAEVGWPDGELSRESPRDRVQRDHLCITTFEEGNGQFSLFASEEDQKNIVSEKAQSAVAPGAFSVSQAEVDAELCNSHVLEGTKLRIYGLYQRDSTPEEVIAFLKKEYNYYSHSHVLLDGRRGHVTYSTGNGMEIQVYGDDGGKMAFKWTAVEKRLRVLVAEGKYLSEKELDQYAEIEREIPVQSGVDPKAGIQQIETRKFTAEVYNAVKEEHPDDMVLFQVGDFFEMYGEDARNAAELLSLTLTARNIPNVGRVDMCGVPAYVLEQYVEKLREQYGVTISAVGEDNTRNTYSLAMLPQKGAQETHDTVDSGKQLSDFAKGDRVKVLAVNFPNHAEHVGQVGTVSRTVKSSNLVYIDLDNGGSYGSFPANIDFEKAREQTIEAAPTIRELYDYYKPIVFDALLKDAAYLNACRNSDRKNAYLEGAAAIKRAITGTDDLQLTKLYYDVSEFHNRLHREVLNETYPLLSETPYQVTQEDIDDVLRKWNGDIDSKRRVVRYMQDHAREKETAAWLAREYGQGYEDAGSFFVTVTSLVGMPPTEPVKLTWTKIQRRIAQLIEKDDFYTQEEIDNFDDIDPVAIREELESDSPSPFVEQVMADVARIAEQEAVLAPDEPTPLPPVTDALPIHSETVAVYPAEQNHLPYDVIIERLRFNDPQQEVKPQNFRITDDNFGVGGAKAKFRKNVDAINLLKKLELENRQAAPNEQEILSRYVGWGGLSAAFDPDKQDWAQEYSELKELLTEEEYKAARESTLTAFYTPPVVIRSIYQALQGLGFQHGKLLEPACGTGNFFGLLPEGMEKSELHGVDLDTISGKIARQLYPSANILVQGFEKTEFSDNSFDAAIGNVPFGAFSLLDRRYDRYNFLIHDYFFAKTLDKVRPGGMIAFITSTGTLDKKNSRVRKYIAKRAELLGAIRLPNNTFKSAAGTQVSSDILFLQKRERPIEAADDWIHLGKNQNGVVLNQYFIDNPDMVLGEIQEISGPHGPETACVPYADKDLGEQLAAAIKRLHGHYEPQLDQQDLQYTVPEVKEAEETLPADPNVRNFSYTIVNDRVYYRENEEMKQEELSAPALRRTVGLIGLRDQTRKLIELQMNPNSSEGEIKAGQKELNRLYDEFVPQFGYISDRANARAFKKDSAYYLLCSLEKLDKEGNVAGKADMFYKRTINKVEPITQVDTSAEALAVSLSERGKVDLDFMATLARKDVAEVVADLRGLIYRLPETTAYVTADEYLSGNIRQKLELAKAYAADDPSLSENVVALENALPEPLTADEIDVRLGATWIKLEYIEQFIFETLELPSYAQEQIKVHYSPLTSAWGIDGKFFARGDIRATTTYGTARKNALDLIEDALNLRQTEVIDYKEENGKRVVVKNVSESILAVEKQEKLKEEFSQWIWTDETRKRDLEQTYNEKFNSTKPREYDGFHLTFPGMNPEIELTDFQRAAIARGIYGGNELIAHDVGGGKTFTMAAIAQKSRQLGICQKNLFIVPNHLTEQWAREYLTLYPNANLLVTTQDDFKKGNRKKFCARIATGDYDAIIMGHSQFMKIPLSQERQAAFLYDQLKSIENGLVEAEAEEGNHFTVKQLERVRKQLSSKLERLQETVVRDDVVTFEELGVDHLFVDEAHHFKNLFLYTKMQNVAGVSTVDSMKASDMKAKCQYIDELTGFKGITFATATPVMNSVAELYTMMRYLQEDRLNEMGWSQFDAWAGQFAEVVTEPELAPEGNGYRERKRLAKYANLPELMRVFHEVADIKSEEELNIPKPKVEFHTEVAQPSEFQKEMVKELSERATLVHIGAVDPSEDNMLKITSDGRKIGLDQRLMNPNLPDFAGSKVNKCVENVLREYKMGEVEKLTQIIFCDTSTPQASKANRPFNIYDDIKSKLIAAGIPEQEIAFIHDANTQQKKEELFRKMRSGTIRILFGSTEKLGEGTNVQDKIIALHDLDCPWRPGDLRQRLGRGDRRGNQNPLIRVYRYVTEGTFDSYLWQGIEKKQNFIDQVMLPGSTLRSFSDQSAASLSYAEIKALCAGNPLIKRKMELEVSIKKLRLQQNEHKRNQAHLRSCLESLYPKRIRENRQSIQQLQLDLALRESHPLPQKGFVGITVDGKQYDDHTKIGLLMLAYCTGQQKGEVSGTYRGFHFEPGNMSLILIGSGKPYEVNLGEITTAHGVFWRIDAKLASFEELIQDAEREISECEQAIQKAEAEYGKPFEYLQELKDAERELEQINDQLDLDGSRERSIKDFARQMYDLTISVIPEYLPTGQSREESITGLVQHIKNGQAQAVCAPLEKIKSIGLYEQREEAKVLLRAYEIKAESWKDSDSQLQEPDKGSSSKNKFTPSIL